MTLFIAAMGVLGVASSGPLIAATLGATSVSALAIAFWRNAIAAVVMAGPTLVREPRRFGSITGREFRWSLLAAVALALHFACFITSLQLTSVAAATALVCLQSAWIAIFQLLREVSAAGTAVLMATHNVELVNRAGLRTVELHQGRLVADHPARPVPADEPRATPPAQAAG